MRRSELQESPFIYARLATGMQEKFCRQETLSSADARVRILLKRQTQFKVFFVYFTDFVPGSITGLISNPSAELPSKR